MASAVGVIVHAWLSPQFDGKLGERLQLGELGSTAQEPEETVKEVSCASAMLTIMTRKMIRASRGTEPTLQRRHGSGVTNAYAMFYSEGHGDAKPPVDFLQTPLHQLFFDFPREHRNLGEKRLN